MGNCKGCGPQQRRMTPKAANNCPECQLKHLSSLYSVLIFITEYEQGYDHLSAAIAHLTHAEREGFDERSELHDRQFLKSYTKEYKQCLYNYLSQYLQFPDIIGFLNLAEEHCTDRQTRQKLYKTRKELMGEIDQKSGQYSKGEAREKRLKQLQDLEVKAEKQGTQEQLDKIRKLHQDLLNGKYTYCQGNAEAQKLIQKLNRQINKRNQHGKNSSDRQKNSAE